MDGPKKDGEEGGYSEHNVVMSVQSSWFLPGILLFIDIDIVWCASLISSAGVFRPQYRHCLLWENFPVESWIPGESNPVEEGYWKFSGWRIKSSHIPRPLSVGFSTRISEAGVPLSLGLCPGKALSAIGRSSGPVQLFDKPHI